MEKELEAKDIRGFIRRRKTGFLICFPLLFFIGIIISLSLPPIFKSVATIRIEDQQIPENFVQPTITDFAEEHIEKVSQNVLSRGRLLQILDRYHLYSELRKKKSPTELVNKIRQNIILETIEAEYKSKKSGKPTTVTVAFNLSFEGKNPETVHRVTDNLANLFLKEDLKRRTELVSVTTDFFTSELKRLQSKIARQEKKISVFKRKHLRELPSDKNANLGAIARLERAVQQADMRLRLLQEKKLLLNSQLSTVRPMASLMIGGKDVTDDPTQRLRGLRFELAKLQTIYSERHPDIKKLKKEIAKVEREIGSSEDSNSNIKLVAEEPDNPLYINLKTQIDSIEMEINAISEDQKVASAKMEVYLRRIENGPFAEKELNALTRNYQNLNRKYSEISNKLMTARVAEEIEGTQKGERFIITSPAYLPMKPTKPNRMAIILLSFLIAIGFSSVLSVFKESIDDTIKSSDQLKLLTDVPVLTPISFIVTKQEVRRKRLKRLGWALVLVLMIGAGLFFVDQYIMKIAEVWSILLERIKMIA